MTPGGSQPATGAGRPQPSSAQDAECPRWQSHLMSRWLGTYDVVPRGAWRDIPSFGVFSNRRTARLPHSCIIGQYAWLALSLRCPSPALPGGIITPCDTLGPARDTTPGFVLLDDAGSAKSCWFACGFNSLRSPPMSLPIPLGDGTFEPGTNRQQLVVVSATVAHRDVKLSGLHASFARRFGLAARGLVVALRK